MPENSFGALLLAFLFLAAALAGMVVCWIAWPRSSNTSPLAAISALLWSATYFATAVLIWRRSRFGAPAFLAAIALLLPLFFFLFPEARSLLVPPFAITCVVALIGYRYLRLRRAPVP